MLEAHQMRVVEESTALEVKIDSLRIFIDGIIYKGLPFVEQELLVTQLHTMRAYQNILKLRIMRFS